VTLSEELSFGSRGWLCRVNEEAADAGRETNWREEVVVRRIYAPRGAIGGVEGTRDVGSVNCVVLAQVAVKTSENVVDVHVVAAVVPPTFDDNVVVPEEPKVALSAASAGDCVYEELKGHCFCPSDVTDTFESLPTGYEPPSAPPVADADPNPDF
jgi:hypothetical protein